MKVKYLWIDDGCAEGEFTCDCGRVQEVSLATQTTGAIQCPECSRVYEYTWIGYSWREIT